VLVLTRKKGQSIIIGDNIKIKIVSINPSGVEIGIEAPRDINIVREELLEKVKSLNLEAANLKIEKDSLNKLKKILNKKD
jgi:carbon storage regulator